MDNLHVIAAVSKNMAIGKNGSLPWNIPEDLRQFKKLTKGHTVIMGRKTFESIGMPLPKRRNLVVSRTLGLVIPGCEVVNSLQSALEATKEDQKVFVIGGASLYEEALQYAKFLYLTHVDLVVENADTFFPDLDNDAWSEVVGSEKTISGNCRFVVYTRKNENS